MESEGSGAAGCSVGSIVWVRRRNGSWWPGKILGPEELSSSHLTSPRSGTPVKLLGREDASVDWYNLEKSKRVKAFRCGEFDDCIEKAESSQGMLIKKREKYARREDAILHALELEKQLVKKQGKLGVASHCTNIKSSSCMQKGLVTSSESLGDDNGKLGNSNLHVFSKRLDMYHKDEIIGDPLSSRKVKDGSQLSGEDDHPEIPPRMRGLQDFGLRIAPSKRKVPSAVTSNGCQKPTADNHAHALPSDGALSMENASHANGKNCLDKRKRSHEGLTEDFLVKRRDKRRPLVQVLQSSAEVGVPHSLRPDCGTVSTYISGVEQTGVTFRAKRSRCVYLPTESSDSLDYNEISPSQIEISASQFGTGNHRPNPDSLIEENSSGFMEDVESDSSETDSSESESDSSETEPDMDEEMAILSGVAVPTEAEQNALGRSEAEEHGSMSTDEHDESASSGDDVSHLYPDHVTANEAVSKWRLKGKRNIRSLPKRFMDATDGKGSIHGTYPEEKGSALSQRALGKSLRFCRNDDFNDGVDEADMKEKDFRSQMVRLDDGYSLKSKAASRGRNMNDWEGMAWEDQPALKGYWDVKRERFGPVYDRRHNFGGRPRSMLVNVDLKVQASYQKEPVPIVSLMSKLNGKAIIGHPIQIEPLEDGSSKTLFSAINDFGNEAIDNENTALSPAWRTARRTANFRVPRPHLSTALGGDETADDPPILDEERKVPFKKLNVGSFGQKASPQIPRPPIDRKLPRKQPKKLSLSSSQKTRTLSSIAIDQNFSIKPKHDSNSCQMDGVIKPESSGPTTVACIPVKLVFSRLLEKINRPPSLKAAAASTNGVLLNSDVERNQS